MRLFGVQIQLDFKTKHNSASKLKATKLNKNVRERTSIT